MNDRMRRVHSGRYHTYTPMLGTSTTALIQCAPCNENESISIMELRTRIQSCAIDLRNRIIGNYNQSLDLLQNVRDHDSRYRNWELEDIVNSLRNSDELYDVVSRYHPYRRERDMNMEFFFISYDIIDYIGIDPNDFPQLSKYDEGLEVIAISSHAHTGFNHTHENIISCILRLKRMIMEGRTYDDSLREVVTQLL